MPPPIMLNFPASIRSTPHYQKFEIGDLLFSKYTCPLENDEVGLWAATDYIVHVISGRKTWRTIDGDWEASTGQTLFFRKGACLVRQHFDADFCVVVFFIPDDFVREVVRDLAGELQLQRTAAADKTVIRLEPDTALRAFIQSMLTYFSGEQAPSPALLRLKLKELIVSVVTGDRNPELAAHLIVSAAQDGPSLVATMEANFRFNLSLPEFAALCHRSLSSFKRDFQRHFGEAPGRWLLHRRLDYARARLGQPRSSITEIVYESGFEDVSHFSRAFKSRFGASPSAFRKPSAATPR